MHFWPRCIQHALRGCYRTSLGVCQVQAIANVRRPGWITCDHAIYLQCFIWGKFLSGPVNQKIWWWGGSTNHSLWGRFTSSNQKSCCLRNGPTKWQDTWTGSIDAKAMAKVGKGTSIYWMHWLHWIHWIRYTLVGFFFASFQSCGHPQILQETLPPCSPQARHIEDFCCTGCYRSPPGKPWEVPSTMALGTTSLSYCLQWLRHVWRRVPLIRVVCLPVVCPVNRRCLQVKTSFVNTFWLLYSGSRKDGMSSCDFPKS